MRSTSIISYSRNDNFQLFWLVIANVKLIFDLFDAITCMYLAQWDSSAKSTDLHIIHQLQLCSTYPSFCAGLAVTKKDSLCRLLTGKDEP